MRALLLAGVVAFGGTRAAHANLLTNGDFETGTLSGYTLTDINGTAGEIYNFPGVFSFDVVQGKPSLAAAFMVGSDNPPELGGASLSQTITTTSGLLSLSFDFASFQGFRSFNLDGGTFFLLLDGQSLNSFDVGFLDAGSTVRGTLAASATVTAGQHTVSALMERGSNVAGVFGRPTPVQYIDNFTADVVGATAVPEPASIALLGIGAAGMVAARRRPAGRS